MLLACLLFAAGCKKDDTSTPTPVVPTSDYYFKFKFDGANYNLNADFPQYMPFNANEAGGYQEADWSLERSVGLRLRWPLYDTVSESDVMSLKGKTLYFSDTLVQPELTYDTSLSAVGWASVDTGNTDYNVKITDVTFLKKDTTAGNPVRTFVITGTCNAVMMNGSTTKIFSDGQFHFIICRRDL